MEELLIQHALCINQKMLIPTLYLTVSIIDTCGYILKGNANANSLKAWYDEVVSPHYRAVNSQEINELRNKILHNATSKTINREDPSIERINVVFSIPPGGVSQGAPWKIEGINYKFIDLFYFADKINKLAASWLTSTNFNKKQKENLNQILFTNY